MRGFVRWYQVANTVVIGFLIVLAIILVVGGPVGPAAAETTNIRGWAWSGTTGWISLNWANCQDLPPQSVCSGGSNDGQECSTAPGLNACTSGGGSCQQVPACKVASPPINYGVDLLLNSDKKGGEVRGYAWSQNLGWLCFGNVCGGTSPLATPPDIAFTCRGLDKDGNPADVPCDSLTWSDAVNNSGTAPSVDLIGWAKAIGLPGDEGWVQLSGSSNVMHGLCSNDAAQVCTLDAQCGSGLCNKGTWTKLFFERGLCSNSNSIICTSDAQCGLATCDGSDSKQGAGLGGWGWSYAGGTKQYGLGWVNFSSSPEVLFPYVYGEGGDVFSGQGIHTAFPPPSGKNNAKYLVHVNGTSTSDLSVRFRSECSDPVACRVKNYRLELPTDPTGDTPYTFKLGRFDFLGLLSSTGGKNRYGQTVVKLDETGTLPQVLDNKVYVVTPQNIPPVYTMNGRQLLNADGIVATSGAGTVVVRGDLQVNGDITYSSNVNVSRQRLASVVWLVLGDVIVAPGVTNLAGTFIVLGHRKDFGLCQGGTNPGSVCTTTSNTCLGGGTCAPSGFGVCVDPGAPLKACTLAGGCTAPQQCMPWSSVSTPSACVAVVPSLLSPTWCAGDSACGAGTAVCRSKCLLKDDNGDLFPSCGRFVTGLSGTTPLNVSGSVFARQFKLQRTYVDPVNKGPAERFTADGRLQLNPPPGMIDFAKGLPLFRRQ